MKVLLLLLSLTFFQDAQTVEQYQTEVVAIIPTIFTEIIYYPCEIKTVFAWVYVGSGIIPDTFCFRRARDRVSCAGYLKNNSTYNHAENPCCNGGGFFIREFY